MEYIGYRRQNWANKAVQIEAIESRARGCDMNEQDGWQGYGQGHLMDLCSSLGAGTLGYPLFGVLLSFIHSCTIDDSILLGREISSRIWRRWSRLARCSGVWDEESDEQRAGVRGVEYWIERAVLCDGAAGEGESSEYEENVELSFPWEDPMCLFGISS